MYNLLVLNVVRHLAAIRHAALEVASAGEVPGASGKEDKVERTAVVVELALDEGAVDYGEDPVEAGYGVGAFFKLAG